MRDAAWDTRFWSAGWRAGFGPLMLLAQALRGDTVVAGPAFTSHTKFQSAYLLASYDWRDWRFSLREGLFATRRANAANDTWSEDGDSFAASVSYAPRDWLRLTGELIAMDSRRGEYVPAGPGFNRADTQFQFSTRFFFWPKRTSAGFACPAAARYPALAAHSCGISLSPPVHADRAV